MGKKLIIPDTAWAARSYIEEMKRGEIEKDASAPQNFGDWQNIVDGLAKAYQRGYKYQGKLGALDFLGASLYTACQGDSKVKYLMEELPFEASEHLDWTREEIQVHEIIDNALNGGHNLVALDALAEEFPTYHALIKPIIKARILDDKGAARRAYNEQCELVPRLKTIVENKPQSTSFQAYEDDYFESLPKREFFAVWYCA